MPSKPEFVTLENGSCLSFWDLEAITFENPSSRIWLVSSLPYYIEKKYSGNLFSEILLIKTKSNRIFDFPEEK